MSSNRRKPRRFTWGVIALTVALLAVAACSSTEEATTTTAGAETTTTTAAPETTTTTAAAETTTTTAAAPETTLATLRLTLGGTSSSSSAFALLTSLMRLAEDADGAMSVSIRETGGTGDNMQLVSEGAADFGLAAWTTIVAAQRGEGSFADNPQPELRNLMNVLSNGLFLVVREDSGVTSVSDLEGKAFAPSFAGSGTFTTVANYLDALGVTVDVFEGSVEDMVNAMKDNRIVGFGKAASGVNADASMLDVASTTDIRIIPFTDEEVATVQAAYPLAVFTTREPGGVFTNTETVVTPVIFSNFFTTTDMDEDTAYRLTKAMWAGIDQAAEEANYDGAKGRTPAESAATADLLPFHPGAERFYREVGAMP